jgi:hypothetical protein
MIFTFISWFFKGPLGRILDSIDKHGTDQVEKDKLKTAALNNFVNAQVAAINGGNPAVKWIMIGVAFPTIIHYAAVCLYSVFWCRGCMAPMTWTIAALPPPFDGWEGAIVMSFFIGATGMGIMSRFK